LSNLIELTVVDHIRIHVLLALIFGDFSIQRAASFMTCSGSRDELTDDDLESFLSNEEILVQIGYAREVTANWMASTWVSYQEGEELDETQTKWIVGALKGIEANRKENALKMHRN